MALIKRPEAGSYEPVIIEDYVKTAVTLAELKDRGMSAYKDSKPRRKWQFTLDVDGTDEKVFDFPSVSIGEGPAGMAKFGRIINAAFGRAKSEPIFLVDDETLEVWFDPSPLGPDGRPNAEPDGRIEPGQRWTVIGVMEPDKSGTPRYNISEYLPAQKRAANAPARAAKPVAAVNDPSDY